MPLPSPTSQRVALVIQYLGTHFHGWQRQPHHRSVQADIEDTLAEIVQHPVTLHGAGRTDSGVHAAAQVAHFDADSPIPAHRWASVLNSRLPQDIVIRGSAQVPPDWHARFSATWRRYRYTLYTDPCPNLFLRPYSWHYYYQPLDVQQMQAALDPLVGHHHLAAFHRAGSNRPHSWVDVQEATCVQRSAVEAHSSPAHSSPVNSSPAHSSPLIQIEIQASGFLYGMMRLLVGLLVQVGRGLCSPDSFTELWQAERRDQVKYSAPAKGLCLLRVGYPEFPFVPEVWFDTFPHLMMSSVPSTYCWNPAS